MRFLRKYESFDLEKAKEWKDASAQEIEDSEIPAYKDTKDFKSIMGEDDYDFIIGKITENFPKEEIKAQISDTENEMDSETALIDMICWFEDKFQKDIIREDVVLDKLRDFYEIP